MANITHLEVISRIIDLKFKWYHTQQTLPCCAALQGAATCPIECHDPKPIAHPFWKFHDDCLKPIYFSVPLHGNKCPYHSSSDSATKVLLFSVVHVCGCKRGNSWTVGDIITKFLLEQEIWSKIAHIWKWLHSDALRCFNIADILTCRMLLGCWSFLGYWNSIRWHSTVQNILTFKRHLKTRLFKLA